MPLHVAVVGGAHQQHLKKLHPLRVFPALDGAQQIGRLPQRQGLHLLQQTRPRAARHEIGPRLAPLVVGALGEDEPARGFEVLVAKGPALVQVLEGCGLGALLLDSVEVASFQAKCTAHGVEHGLRQLYALCGRQAGQRRVGGEQRLLLAEVAQPSVGDGEQVQLVEVGVVEAPAPPQVTQQSIAEHVAQRALSLLPCQAHELGCLQVLRQRVRVAVVEAESLEDGIGEVLLGENAAGALQRSHQGRSQGEQEDEVVEVPGLECGVLAVVGEAE